MDDVGVADVLAEKDTVVDVEGHAGPGASDCVADVLVLPELETVEVVDAEAPAGTADARGGRRRCSPRRTLWTSKTRWPLVRATAWPRCSCCLSSRPWRWWMQTLPAGMDDVGVADVLAEKDTVDVEDTLAPGEQYVTERRT
jgi:hypothetical protein